MRASALALSFWSLQRDGSNGHSEQRGGCALLLCSGFSLWTAGGGLLITNVQFTPALRDFCWEIEEVNRASVSTASQRDETKWQNTCTAEYLNGCQLLVTLGKEKKSPQHVLCCFSSCLLNKLISGQHTGTRSGNTRWAGALCRVIFP